MHGVLKSQAGELKAQACALGKAAIFLGSFPSPPLRPSGPLREAQGRSRGLWSVVCGLYSLLGSFRQLVAQITHFSRWSRVA